MSFNPLSLLEKLINEHGSATILGKNLSLVKDQLGVATKKIADLEKENSELKDRVSSLESRLKKEVIPKDFIEHSGVLFRRLETGNYERTVYCPACKTAMSSFQGIMEFKCPCGFKAPFTGKQLEQVISEIE